MENNVKKTLYESKYAISKLTPSPYFSQQFSYLTKYFTSKKILKILDLGGGTGEFSLILQKLGHDVTLFDFSENAILHAKQIGVKNIICADFNLYEFENTTYDVILVKGFSLLNTDNPTEFINIIKKIKKNLASQGVILYWGNTNLSGKWSESGWYNLSQSEIKTYFDDCILFPAFRYQTFLPLRINRLISTGLLFFTLPRLITFIGIIR